MSSGSKGSAERERATEAVPVLEASTSADAAGVPPDRNLVELDFLDVETSAEAGIRNPDFEDIVIDAEEVRSTGSAMMDRHGSGIRSPSREEEGGLPPLAEATEASEVVNKVDFDDVLATVGEFGRFQGLVFTALSLGILIEVMLVLDYVFVAATPAHWCTVPELQGMNLTLEEIYRFSLPVDNATETGFSQCEMYARNYSGWTADDVIRWLNASSAAGNDSSAATTTTCQSGWSYDKSIYSSTIVTDWDLVCGDSWMASFAYTALALGQLVGATFWGAVSDRFGRRRPYFLAMLLMIGFGVLVSFSPNFVVYCLFQAVVGINTVACFASGVTIAVELSGVTWRGHLATAINYFWTFGYMLLAVVAYGIRDWRYLQLVISAPSLLFLLTAIFVPESPRWLYSRRRTEEADRIVRKMVDFNHQTLRDDLDIYVDTSEEDVRSSCADLCQTNRMRINTLLLGFIWFANALVYYGVSLFMPTMGGNVYLNFFLSGVVELPGYAIAQLSITYLGRRWPLCVTLTVAGVALVCTMVVPSNLGWLSITLTMVGKLCVTASWAIAICFTAELYPTVVRAKGMFTSTLCGNIGNSLAPMVGLLSVYSPYIPLGAFGVVAVVAGLASLIPPETKGTHLLDKIPTADSSSYASVIPEAHLTMKKFQKKSGFDVDESVNGVYRRSDSSVSRL